MKLLTDFGYPKINLQDPSLTLGSRIKAWRLKLGLTQEVLAEHSGLLKSTLSTYERDQIHSPSLSIIQKIAQVLQIQDVLLLDPTSTSGSAADIICPPISHGNKLKNARLKNNIKRKELAQMVGVNAETIRLYETNHHKPNSQTISKLSKLLNTQL